MKRILIRAFVFYIVAIVLFLRAEGLVNILGSEPLFYSASPETRSFLSIVIAIASGLLYSFFPVTSSRSVATVFIITPFIGLPSFVGLWIIASFWAFEAAIRFAVYSIQTISILIMRFIVVLSGLVLGLLVALIPPGIYVLIVILGLRVGQEIGSIGIPIAIISCIALLLLIGRPTFNAIRKFEVLLFKEIVGLESAVRALSRHISISLRVKFGQRLLVYSFLDVGDRILHAITPIWRIATKLGNSMGGDIIGEDDNGLKSILFPAGSAIIFITAQMFNLGVLSVSSISNISFGYVVVIAMMLLWMIIIFRRGRIVSETGNIYSIWQLRDSSDGLFSSLYGKRIVFSRDGIFTSEKKVKGSFYLGNYHHGFGWQDSYTNNIKIKVEKEKYEFQISCDKVSLTLSNTTSHTSFSPNFGTIQGGINFKPWEPSKTTISSEQARYRRVR